MRLAGHGLEGDLGRRDYPLGAGKLGQQAASEKLQWWTMPPIAGKYGSYAYDDEGNPGQKTVLIENGVLVQYMNDLETARRTGAAMYRNGRRESIGKTADSYEQHLYCAGQ